MLKKMLSVYTCAKCICVAIVQFLNLSEANIDSILQNLFRLNYSNGFFVCVKSV